MNIYVGNLSYETTEKDLESTFSEFGKVVSVKIIKDQYNGRSKGFGFIEIPDWTEANKAIEGMNGRELKGRTIKVNKAKERSDRGSRRGGKQFRGRHF